MLEGYSWKLFLAEVLIGVGVMSLWVPVAFLLGIAQPWISIIFFVVWVIFWNVPVGHRLRANLIRIINGIINGG